MRKWSQLKTMRQKRRRLGHIFQIFWNRTKRPFETAWYWLRTHTFHRYHIIDARSPQNGYGWGWVDRDKLILLACFNILRDFVEKEDPKIGLQEKTIHSPEWKEEQEILDRQYILDLEVRALYNWWTRVRAEEHSLADRMLQEETTEIPEKWEGFFKDIKKQRFDRWHALHEYLREKDNEMLRRLMDVRERLWT